MDEKQPILLIDFSALFRRAWHVASEVSHAFDATIGGVNRAHAMMPDALVAVCCDGRGNWRKELYGEYKAQRENQPNEMYGEMQRTVERLHADGRLIWKFDGFEADDIIATACERALDNGHCVRIASHDKDLMQLIGVRVDYLATHLWQVVGAEKVREKFGVEPEQLGDWLALKGDSSDNVPGCPGVGDKTATELLQKCGSLAGIWSALDPPAGETPVTIATPNVTKNLLANYKQVELSRKLVGFRAPDNFNFDEIYEKREPQELETVDYMNEAEKDAEKYFGKVSEKTETAPSDADKSATVAESSPLQPDIDPDVNRGTSQTATAPVDMIQRDKTPEEIAEVSRPVETVSIVEYSKQLEPRSFREAMIYADVMFKSRVYSRYPSPAAMAAAIVRGREMGYGAGTSLDIFHVADFNRDGQLRLIMLAHLIIERVTKDPSVEYFYLEDGSDEKQATYVAKKRQNPKEQRFTYTIEDAKLAGLVKTTANGQPNTWMKRPKEQLRKTCGVQFGRVIAPGAAVGLYCMEELGIDE